MSTDLKSAELKKHPTLQRPLWSRPYWRWLFSLKAGLWLLALLTVASIIGTLIPEVRDAKGQVVESALARSQRLVFYSWWYLYLLLLPMAVNMACATYRTIVEKVLPAGRPRFQRQPAFYTAAANRGEAPFTGGAEAVAAAFRRRGFRVFAEGTLGYAVKGMIARWGAPISHVGMVIVLLGGFASAWMARESGVWLLEGETTEHMAPRAEGEMGAPLGFQLRCEDFETGYFPKTRIPSKFTSIVSVKEGEEPWRTGPVEVNHSLTAGGWTLHQTEYREIPEWERYVVAVKAPDRPTTATVEISPGQRRAVAGLAGTEVEISETAPQTWTVYRNDQAISSGSLAQHGGGWIVRVERFEPHFVMMDAKTIGSRSQELKNPALKVTLLSGGRVVQSQWLFGLPEMKEMMKGMQHQQQNKYELELMQVTGSTPNWRFEVAVRDTSGAKVGDYTMAVGEEHALTPEQPEAAPAAAPGGWNLKVQERVPGYQTYLSLTRNPMIPVIYFGCAVMLLGLMVAFMARSRQVWFRVDEAARKVQVAAIYRHQAGEGGLDGATKAVLEEMARGK